MNDTQNFSDFMDFTSESLIGISGELRDLSDEILGFKTVDEQEQHFISSLLSDLDKLHDLVNCLAGRCSEYHHQRELINAGIQDKINKATMQSIFKKKGDPNAR